MNILQTLNKGELLYGYKNIVLYYEQNVVNAATSFDARKSRWKKYCKKSHIKFDYLNYKYINNFQTKSFPFFCYNNRSGETRTEALFRHLRNAYAHGNVEKIKINNQWWYYCFEDKNDSGKVTMQGQIPERKLKELIQELKENQK